MVPLIFILDESDRLVDANEEWDTFAAANGGPTFDTVRGRPLAGFIDSPELRLIWRHLLGRVRQGAVVRGLPIAAGDPTSEMTRALTTRRAAHGIVIVHTVPCRPAPSSAFRGSADGTDEFLTLCSWCQRVRVDDRWFLLEDAVAFLRLLERRTLPSISHGMCDLCYREIDADLKRRARLKGH